MVHSIEVLKTWRNVIVAGLTAVSLSACDVPLTVGDTALATKNNRPVNVALMVPSGSGDVGLESLANSMINSARLAIAENPGTQINLRVYSTAGDPARGRQLAQAARADGIDIIVGPLRASVANVIGVEMARTNTAVLTMSNTGAIAGGNVFVMGNTYENTANRLMSFVSGQGLRSVVALASNDVTGGSAVASVQKAANAAGVRFDGSVTYELTQESISASTTATAQKIKATGSQALILAADSGGALPLLGQFLPAAGVLPSSTKYLGLARWDIPSRTLTIPGLQTGWFAVPDLAAAQGYSQRYRAKYSSAPERVIGAAAYDGMLAVINAAKRGGLNNLSPAMMAKAPAIVGANGLFKLQPSGLTRRGLAIAEVSGGTYKIINTAPRTFRGAGF